MSARQIFTTSQPRSETCRKLSGIWSSLRTFYVLSLWGLSVFLFPKIRWTPKATLPAKAEPARLPLPRQRRRIPPTSATMAAV